MTSKDFQKQMTEYDLQLPETKRVIRGSELVDIIIAPGEPIQIRFHSAIPKPVVKVSVGGDPYFAKIMYKSVRLEDNVDVVCNEGKVPMEQLREEHTLYRKLKETLLGMIG